MALGWSLAVVLLLESLAAATLGLAAARARLVGDRRLAIEAELALESAMALARVTHDQRIATLPPGATVPLAPPAISGWEVSVLAGREAATTLAWLHVAVRRRTVSGALLAGRRGTLLLVTGAADTAIVLSNRPRW